MTYEKEENMTRLRRLRSSKRPTMTVLAVTAVALLTLTACGGTKGTAAADTAPTSTAVTLVEALPAGQWIANFGDYKEAANWDAATPLTLDLGAGMIMPSNLDLVAGQPYTIEISNSDTVEHGLSAPDFFRASGVRKTESPGGEIKLTLFREINVAAGKSTTLYVVPVMPGVTQMDGTTDGVVTAAMTGTISVTGTVPTTPAPVIESISTAGEVAGAADLIAAAKPTWDTAAQAVTIEMGDNGSAHFYKPKVTTLKVGVPVTLTFSNKGIVLHEYSAVDFFATCALWKVSTAEGSDSGGLVRPADLEAGGVSSLYVIPTKAGTYKLSDGTPGMETMAGTIIVK